MNVGRWKQIYVKFDCRMEGALPRPAFTRLVTASSATHTNTHGLIFVATMMITMMIMIIMMIMAALIILIIKEHELLRVWLSCAKIYSRVSRKTLFSKFRFSVGTADSTWSLDFKQQHFQILARRYISCGRKIYIFWPEDIYLLARRYISHLSLPIPISSDQKIYIFWPESIYILDGIYMTLLWSKGSIQKNTVLFGNFSQIVDASPPPHPLLIAQPEDLLFIFEFLYWSQSTKKYSMVICYQTNQPPLLGAPLKKGLFSWSSRRKWRWRRRWRSPKPGRETL